MEDTCKKLGVANMSSDAPGGGPPAGGPPMGGPPMPGMGMPMAAPVLKLIKLNKPELKPTKKIKAFVWKRVVLDR